MSERCSPIKEPKIEGARPIEHDLSQDEDMLSIYVSDDFHALDDREDTQSSSDESEQVASDIERTIAASDGHRNEHPRANSSDSTSAAEVKVDEELDEASAALTKMADPFDVHTDTFLEQKNVDEEDEPVYDAGYKMACEEARLFLSRLLEILYACPATETTDLAIHKLYHSARALLEPHATKDCVILALGDSGSGKSSMLNSLFGGEPVAKVGTIQATTSFITEYRQKPLSQTHKL